MFGGRMCHHGSTLIVPLPPLSYEEDDLKKSPPLRFLGLAMGMVRDKKQGKKKVISSSSMRLPNPMAISSALHMVTWRRRWVEWKDLSNANQF
ncbi:hypothetical protein ACFX19_016819 [Malus domestica]